MNRYFFIIFFVSLVNLSLSQNEKKSQPIEINWMTWAEVQQAQKETPKKVLVDVYTNWCGWCKKMDAITFHNEKIVKYINDNYYAIKFNAENRETIVFRGKKYNYIKSGRRGYNELATSLLDGTMSFPSTVFLDENLDLLTTVGGYLEPITIEPIISFFATESYLKMKWSQYEKKYKSIL